MRKSKKFLSLALSLVMALALCVPAFAEEGEVDADIYDAAGSSISDDLRLENSVFTYRDWIWEDGEASDTRWETPIVLGETETHDYVNIFALPLGASLKMDFPEEYFVDIYARTDEGNGVYRQRLGKSSPAGEGEVHELVPANVSAPLLSFEDDDGWAYYRETFYLEGSDNVHIVGYFVEHEPVTGTVSLTGDYLTNLFGPDTIVEVAISEDLTICLYLTGETLDAATSAPAASEAPAAPASTGTGFSDVADTSAFAPGVKWAVENNVTTGYSDGTFKPSDTCTQANILTFLWRGAGRPDAADSVELEGLDGSEYFYIATQWAFEQGLINDFNANGPCTRSMVVTYLWKLAGSPEVSSSVSFADVAADAEYAQAVAWAVENGITNGTGDGNFSPDASCTRGQIVTFLYRNFAK